MYKVLGLVPSRVSTQSTAADITDVRNSRRMETEGPTCIWPRLVAVHCHIKQEGHRCLKGRLRSEKTHTKIVKPIIIHKDLL